MRKKKIKETQGVLPLKMEVDIKEAELILNHIRSYSVGTIKANRNLEKRILDTFPELNEESGDDEWE